MKFPTLVLFVIGLFLLGAACGYAAEGDVGAAELQLLEKIFTGNIGLTLGLIVAAVGIFTFVNGNIIGGIIMVVLGVLITLLPGVYNGLRALACPIAESLGGKCGDS